MTTREQPVRAPTGLPYGEKKKLEEAQQAIPLPAQPSPGGGGQGQQQEQPPVQPPNVFAESERPNEPLTAGASEGPGPANMGMLPKDELGTLRAVYMQFPSPGLRRLIERYGRKFES